MQDHDALLARVGAGDREAYARLYAEARPRMIGYAAAILGGDASAGEDAVNEAFADIWRLVGRFNPVGNATAWIRRIVRNKAIDMLRKPCNRELAVDETVFRTLEDHESNPEEAAQLSDEARWLRKSLVSLNPDQREAIVLCYFEALSVEQISEQTRVPVGTVKTRLYHARRRMHGWLECNRAPMEYDQCYLDEARV